MSADDTPDLMRALAQFQQDLAALKAGLDLSFADMERRLRQLDLPDARGSDTTFSSMLQRPLTKPPRKATLRGFLAAVGVDSPAELASWEGRRLELVQRCAQANRTSATNGSSTEVSTTEATQVREDTIEDSANVAETGAVHDTTTGESDRQPGATTEDTSVAQPELAGEGQDGPAEPSPPPALAHAHRRAPSRRVLVGLAVILVVLGVGIALLIWRPWASSADDLQEVSGHVTCVSGAAVSGVYLVLYEGAGGAAGASRFVQWHADPNRPVGASYAAVVPLQARYALHVGCGAQPSGDWITDNWSDPMRGSGHQLNCDDRVPLQQNGHFGSCMVS